MKKIIVASLIFSFFTISSISAEIEKVHFTPKKHQAGVRLGVWNNGGAVHTSPIVNSNDSLVVSIKDNSFYIEGFYAYNIFGSFFSEFSLGVVNRGDMQLYSFGIYDFSNLLIYPLNLQLKFYPLNHAQTTFQPFIGAGGGAYFAKQDIQFSNDYYTSYYQVDGDSKTDFTYTLSGGLDWQIRENFSFELQGKYMPIKFSENFIGEKDYTATTITIGLKYKYNSVKK